MKFFSWVPNFLTICNLLCGCAAIINAMRGDFVVVFWLVVIAAVFDFADGFAARMLKAYSPMGKELDSLADMVSFGVVPSFVMFAILQSHGFGLWSYGAFFIAAMSALRLAKFNIDTRQTDSFIGMPTPACSLFIVSYAVVYPLLAEAANYLSVATIVALGFLLVSELPMFSFKFKNFGLKNNALRYGFALFALVAIIVLGYGGVAVVILAYILTSAVLAIAARR